MNREEFEISAQLERIGITINVTQDNPVARIFLNPSPPNPIAVKIYQRMRDDSEQQTIFSGTIKQCQFEDEEARLICESIQAAIKRPGLQRAHSRTCNHVLYDTNTCKVIAGSFSSTGFIQSVQLTNSRITITPSPLRAAGWFTTGDIVRSTGERCMVISDTTSGNQHTLDLLRPVAGLAVNESLTLEAGCLRTYEVCSGKFANQVNYGGFPHAPLTNPFETDLR
jgi:uncharacterized phage protein (TIGR02218 family)